MQSLCVIFFGTYHLWEPCRTENPNEQALMLQSWLSDPLHPKEGYGGESLQMDLLVLDQGHLLMKDLSDKRTGLVDAGSLEQRNPCSLALTTVSPDPQPRSRLCWGILGPQRWKRVLGGKLGWNMYRRKPVAGEKPH